MFDDQGCWIDNKDGIKHIVVNYFHTLFMGSNSTSLPSYWPNLFPRLAHNALTDLNLAVTGEEIKNALFSIGSLKAPGPDGFPAMFYQKCWDTCETEIINMVQSTFLTATLPDHINQTLISLVPKTDNPTTMASLLPISLCNTIYKSISKIIVGRIRPLLKDIISPAQTSFVPGRQISDNVLIVQEVLNLFRRTKGKKGYIAWKVDLSKAYDRISWKFILDVLWEVGFRGRILELIKQCISTVEYQALVNGEKTEKILPRSGLRQGDPLSPYLFVLCMEKLSQLIDVCVDANQWKPVRVSRNGPRISHVFFADDLILFAEANVENAQLMRRCVDSFCEISGQRVSYEKSCVYVSSNIGRMVANQLADMCGSPLTSDLGKYLGVPLIHKRITRNTYNYLLDKVSTRLASWKARTLSLAGRLTLIKSVTSSIPIYVMQTTKLPASICDELDQFNRNFLWGHTEDNKTVHLVKWSTVTKPKAYGGLGIRDTRMMNQALLAKIGWRLIHNKEMLWARVLESKYLSRSTLHEGPRCVKGSDSVTWKGVCHGINLLNEGLQWRVGRGDKIRFWSDCWAPIGNLKTYALNPDLSGEENLTISMFLKDYGWDEDELAKILPRDVISSLLPIYAGRLSSLEDKCIWGMNKNGEFSVRSAACMGIDNHEDWKWKFI